jgi:hypothetical protein
MQRADDFYGAMGLVLMPAEEQYLEYCMLAKLRTLRQTGSPFGEQPNEQDAAHLLDHVFLPCLPFRIWPIAKGADDSAPQITAAKAAERLFMWMFLENEPDGCLSFLDETASVEEVCQDKERLFAMLAATVLDRVVAALPLSSLYNFRGESLWARLCQACKEPTTRGKQVVIVCLWRCLTALCGWHKHGQKVSSSGKYSAFSFHCPAERYYRVRDGQTLSGWRKWSQVLTIDSSALFPCQS